MEPAKSKDVVHGAEEDATVRVSPGGPPPPNTYKDEEAWTWSPSSAKHYVKISVGSKLALDLKQNGKGYVIKIKPRPRKH